MELKTVEINGTLYLDDNKNKWTISKMLNNLFNKINVSTVLYKEWCISINRWETKTTYLGFINIYKLSLFGNSNKYRLFRSKSDRIIEYIKH